MQDQSKLSDVISVASNSSRTEPIANRTATLSKLNWGDRKPNCNTLKLNWGDRKLNSTTSGSVSNRKLNSNNLRISWGTASWTPTTQDQLVPQVEQRSQEQLRHSQAELQQTRISWAIASRTTTNSGSVEAIPRYYQRDGEQVLEIANSMDSTKAGN